MTATTTQTPQGWSAMVDGRTVARGLASQEIAQRWADRVATRNQARHEAACRQLIADDIMAHPDDYAA